LWSAKYFPALDFMKTWFLKSSWYPKSKAKVNEVNLSNNIKILDLLKYSMYLEKSGQCYEKKNESSIHSIALNSVHPEHSWFFLKGSLLRAIYSWTSRIYSIGSCSLQIGIIYFLPFLFISILFLSLALLVWLRIQAL
jgi:hypothetical protein